MYQRMVNKEGFLALKKVSKCYVYYRWRLIGKQKPGEGGYYSRLFLNVKGREPQGIVEPKDYMIRDMLKEKLEALGDGNGKPIGTKVYKPQELYRKCNGIPPDLIVIFGDLYWRSIGTVGHGKVHIFENDIGIDYANHSQYGIFIMSSLNNDCGCGKKLSNLHLIDIAPTVLNLFNMEVPNEMHGKVIKAE